MSDDELDLLSMYRGLHDGLSDMIESGRLSRGDIPDDYQWLVETLAEASALDSRVKKLLAEEGGYDEDEAA